MRKYLLPKEGMFYKANLHCHSTVSDGKKTPEELKEIYMNMGYSIIAYTDHDVLIPHTELNDESFLALHGFEMEVMNKYGSCSMRDTKRCDMGLIALEQDNLIQPCWHRELYLFANAKLYREQVQFDENERNYYRSYTPECISDMMTTCREKGFFVTLNHPTWSREDYSNYSKYEGLHAVEMFNGGCLKTGYEEYNPRVYDDILRTGKKIYCTAGDDNHNTKEPDSVYSDSGVAFTMIKADKLEYRTITKALEAGHFYASEGPEIYELYVEDNRVHIKCSPAAQITCNYDKRGAGNILAENGQLVTEADFNADPKFGYFRITVKDERGFHACTNAYFPEDCV